MSWKNHFGVLLFKSHGERHAYAWEYEIYIIICVRLSVCVSNDETEKCTQHLEETREPYASVWITRTIFFSAATAVDVVVSHFHISDKITNKNIYINKHSLFIWNQLHMNNNYKEFIHVFVSNVYIHLWFYA